jgi:O-antigen ligase
MAVGLVLLAYIALRSVLEQGLSPQSWRAIHHYHELLMLPILWALLRNARRPNAFTYGLVAGAIVAALAMTWTAANIFESLPAPLNQLQAKLDYSMTIRRISMGFGLSICAFLLFEHARTRRISPIVGYGLAASFAITVLFVGEGRTGHLVLLVLVGCAAYRAAPRKWRYPVAMGVLGITVLAGASSAPVRTRVVETVAALSGTPDPYNTYLSTRIRMEMIQNAVGVVRDNWVAGTGWSSYGDAMRKMALARHPETPEAYGSHSNNPHNEYLLQLGAGGLPALALFVLWMAWPMWRGWREERPDQPWTGVAACVALAFAVGAAFNSLLFDYMEAHLYVAVMAWLYVCRVERS